MAINLLREYPMMPQLGGLARLGFFIKDIVGYDPPHDIENYHKLKQMAIEGNLLEGFNSQF
jgi:hypothetical protein